MVRHPSVRSVKYQALYSNNDLISSSIAACYSFAFYDFIAL